MHVIDLCMEHSSHFITTSMRKDYDMVVIFIFTGMVIVFDNRIVIINESLSAFK